MTVSEAIELAALQRQPASELAELAQKEGMVTMRQDGILKASQGLTTIDEIMKATSA
jgi:type II secretory ATPase GspE/PulE/Tfp pilus assembly ATPase PilB-like protein